MYIKELKVQNFKSFNGDISTMVFNMPNGECGSGLNIFVGENNTGKSTIFEAIDFLKNGIKKLPEEIKNKNNPTEDVVVEITFEGNITGTIDSFSKKN
ncbi:AAA family ATPase [Bathymodiolus azoricus thioautotrophic gill symbiont]|nr:AAA family ATPase [Bathymodiolus azoricus thioautotrophic gill symbiont]